MLYQLLPPGPLALALPLFPWCVLGVGLLAAALFDLRWRRVPNWMSVGLLASGLLSRGLVAGPLPIAWGVAGAGAALLVLFVPFKRRWIGAGDVKLLIAVGGWLGPLLLAYSVLASAVLGGVLSVIWLLRAPAELRREVQENLKTSALARTIPDVGERPPQLSPPLAPAIAAGTAAVVALFARQLVT